MPRVLLVARHGEQQIAILQSLRASKACEVTWLELGAEAFREAKEGEYQVVLVDAELPDTNGFALCQRMREDSRTQTLPIFVCVPSAWAGNGTNTAKACGATDLITLPIGTGVLMDRLRPHLQARVELGSERTRELEEIAGELRIERDALRETFDVFQDGLLLVSSEGEVLIENTAAGRMLDESSEEVQPVALGESWDGSSRKSLRESITDFVREAVVQNSTINRTLVLRKRQLEVRANPAAGGRALVYLRDVTEERDREMRRLQSEKLASIGMLAAGVAHEINNPASFVLANVETLAGMLRSVDETLRAARVYEGHAKLATQLFDAMTVVQESKEGMARIHRIARDLHSFSRVDDDATALSDVNAAVDSALTMLRSELRYRATVERSLRATQPVRASAARLAQVFLNLLVNAAHALADLHPRRNRLYVRSRDEAGQVIVEIEDNGPGIPAEIMPRIFESFFTTKPPEIGTGLGLPISLDIVRRAGGDLVAESEPGRGAVFRVVLPAAAGVPAVKTRTVPQLKAIQRRRVLAIDDEALLLKAFQRMLISHHDIETKLGAREALRYFGQDRRFDAVLCDLQMPDMSGVELYMTVKQQWPSLAERFIFITGGAFSPEARRFLEDPTITCINKPFQLRELLELIEARVGACEAVS
jgi:signal transduction histidine kinase/ActR/RegA family two-component response regulator